MAIREKILRIRYSGASAAVAWVLRKPTMEVSMYCTAVCISYSIMVGQASARMVTIMALLIWIPFCLMYSLSHQLVDVALALGSITRGNQSSILFQGHSKATSSCNSGNILPFGSSN